MTTQHDGRLRREDDLRETGPNLCRDYLDAEPTRIRIRIRMARQRTPDEQPAYAAQMGDMSIRDGFRGIADRGSFNAAWAEIYARAGKDSAVRPYGRSSPTCSSPAAARSPGV